MKRLLTSCFGLGWLPFAPGSWGSLPPTVTFWLMWHFHAPGVVISIVMAALALAGSIVCVRFAPAAIAATGRQDPPEVVADEVAGQAITFLAIPLLVTVPVSAVQAWLSAAVGFLFYRAFDAVKPGPIRRLERLPKGWGILTDDLAAGVCAAIATAICVRFWIVG